MHIKDRNTCVLTNTQDTEFLFSPVYYIFSSLSFAAMLALAMYTHIVNSTIIVPCLFLDIRMDPPHCHCQILQLYRT